MRINDRGPFKKGRLIDLSYGAARELGFLSAGHGHGGGAGADRARPAPGRSSPAPPRAACAGPCTCRWAPSASGRTREDLKRRLEQQGFANVVIRYDARSEPALYRVRVGPVADAAEYDAVVGRVTRLDIGEPRLVVESAGADWSSPTSGGQGLPGG